MITCKEKTIELLNEVRTELDNAGIEYFLSGELVLFERDKVDIDDEFNNASILVFAEDIDKITEILGRKSGRKVESLANNRKFPGFYMRYMDINTTLFDYSEANLAYDDNSFGINIEIICGSHKRTLRNKVLFRLKRIWVIGNMPYYMEKRGRKDIIKQRLIRVAFNIFGRKCITKWLFAQWIDLGREKTEKYKIATAKGNIFGLQSHILDDVVKTEWLEGEFNIVNNVEKFVNKYFGDKKKIKTNRHLVYEFEVPWKKSAEILKTNDIELNEYRKQEQIYRNWVLRKYHPMHLKRERYYSYMFCAEDRMRMYRQLKDKKDQILSLHEKRDFIGLGEYLEEYIEMIRKYARYNVGFCSDSDIFKVALTVMLEEAFENSNSIASFKVKSNAIIKVIKNTNYMHFDAIENVFWGKREEKEVLVDKKRKILKDIRKEIRDYNLRIYNRGREMSGTILKKCGVEDIERTLEYIGEDKLLCFYLYMDVLECGIEDEGLGLWISEFEDEIQAVMYQYYDCLHIFTRRNFPLDDILSVIELIDPKVIVSSKGNIMMLQDAIDADKEKYIYELNHIITTDVLMKENPDVEVSVATKEDVPEIVDMMMKDHIYYEVYTHDKLRGDLERRLESGFGRLFIIRDESGKLVCADATNAETDDLAVIGGLVTAPEMRGRGLGAAMTGKVWNTVLREGKRGLAFLLDDNEKTINLHKKLGYDFIGYSARLIKK